MHVPILMTALIGASGASVASPEGPVRWVDSTLAGMSVDLSVGAALCGVEAQCLEPRFAPAGACAYSDLVSASVRGASAGARVGGLIEPATLWFFTEGFATATSVRGGTTRASVQSAGSISKPFEVFDHCDGCPFEVAVGIVDGEVNGVVGAAVEAVLHGDGVLATVAADRCGPRERTVRICDVAAGQVLTIDVLVEVAFAAVVGDAGACPEPCGPPLAVVPCGAPLPVTAADLLTGCRPVVGETDGVWIQVRPVTCRGDANRDGAVDVVDLIDVILGVGFVDCDDVLEVDDLLVVIDAWGECSRRP